MAQIFSKTADTWLRATLLSLAVAVFGVLVLAEMVARSDYVTAANYAPPQPVPFSHQHHVAGLGLDCRYCHASVEVSADAGMPPTHTCMTCHSQIWTNAPVLAPVRESLAQNKPLEWQRVALLPDYAYFRHDIHVQKGVGCSECHGRVDAMPLTYKANAFRMQWCLDCHRDPAPHLRPKDQVTNMSWTPPEDARALGTRLAREYHVKGPEQLTHCYVCHR
jgi:hypothetical protein